MAGNDDPDVGQRSDRPDRILLVMEPGRDRELLADWLATVPQCEISTVANGQSLPETYDLCLLDPPSLSTYRSALQRRKREADPSYLPHVLVVSETDSRETPGNVGRKHSIATDKLLDDVLTAPVEKAVLRQRLENLLQARRTSRLLAEREEQYRELVNLVPEAIVLVDDGHIVYANDAAAALFQLDDRTSLDGRTLESFVMEDDRDALETLLRTAVDDGGEGRSELFDLTLESTTGSPIEAVVTGVAVTYEGRQVTQLLVRDMTAQKRREQRLRLFQRAIESAAQGITIADARQEDVPLIYANEGFTRITGYDIEEVLGMNCRFLQGSNTADEQVRALREAIQAGEAVSVDIINYRKDGTPFWNRVDIVPITDGDGSPTHFLGFQRDITERKHREQRLSVLNRILRHNLRNKLNLIRGYAEEIEFGGENQMDGAEKIRRAADELLEMSEQVREFDTVITESPQELTTLDLVAIVEEGTAALREQSSEADIRVSAPEMAKIAGHPALRAALLSLLRMLAASETPRCSVEITPEDDGVALEVIDRGNALSRSDIELVARDVETSLEHLQGLELWLLRWAVEKSNGEFGVDTSSETPVIHMRFRSVKQEEKAELRGVEDRPPQ